MLTVEDKELIDRANFESWLYAKTNDSKILVRANDKYIDEITERTWQQFKQLK